MKVLFLDIDGVCNCESTFSQPGNIWLIDPTMAFLVRKIVSDTECKVVLSSTWRHSDEGIDQVNKQVCPVFDHTQRRSLGFRGSEVDRWLKEHPEVERYAILDDDADFFKWQPLFKTNWKTGLTADITDDVIEYLKDI